MNVQQKLTPTEPKKHVVLGITGGIAAYKACEVLRLLQKNSCEVRVVMTENACQFISPLTFETLSGYRVAHDTFHRESAWEVEHIALAKWADLFLVAPATANIIAKMASGIADDMLSTTLLAARSPVLVAPAMNTAMLMHPATQKNIQTLQDRGVHFVEAVSGYLACGDEGAGKLASPEQIAEEALRLLNTRKDLEGLHIAVTAGPTQEPLDPVRFMTNHSTGKMGYAIAEAARARGAVVTLLSGPVTIPAPRDVQVVRFQTTQDLLDRMLEIVDHQDILIQAAAPADFRAKVFSEQKIKKHGKDALTIDFVSNPDVAATIGEQKQPHQVFVGFAAETTSVEKNAVEKLVKKNLDIIVANDVTQSGAGFGVDTNIVTIITAKEQKALPLMPKREVADNILDTALRIYEEKRKSK